MVMLWLAYLLLGLDPLQPALGQTAPPVSLKNLYCVNDFVNKVICRWAPSDPPSGAAPPSGCRVRGSRDVWVRETGRSQLRSWSCELKALGGNETGCSFVFEDPVFSWAEALLGVQVDCGETTVENMTKYPLRDHIQMNPPGLPSVSSSPNETLICWAPGSPLSRHLEDTKEFELQIKHRDQRWQEGRTLITPDQELRFPSLEGGAGPHQVRVRVRPLQWAGSQWSAWGPVASWDLDPRDPRTPGQVPLEKTLVSVLTAGPLALGLLIFITLLFMIFRYKPRLFRSKPVPDPSKYFQGRCSLPGPGLKTWLNPHSSSRPYFTSFSPDSFSSVAVSPPPPSSAALLRPLCSGAPSQYPPPFSYVSSSSPSSSSSSSDPPSSSSSSSNPPSSSSSDPPSSSCFSNPTYAPDDGSPGDGTPVMTPTREPRLLRLRPLHLGPFTPAPAANQPPLYPPTEPQSPDSGISVGPQYLPEEGRAGGWEEEEEKCLNSLWEHGLSHVFFLAAQSSPGVPPSITAPDHAPPQSQPPWPWSPPPLDEEEGDYDAYEEEYDLMPVGGAMGRSSSMPVESCSGYHTLKDLQTTYSSVSI